MSGPPAPAPDPVAWRTCRFCGGAVPPDGSVCPTCGQNYTVATDQIASLPPPARRWLRVTQAVRVAIVVAVAAFLAYAIIGAAWTGPPTVADPLTTAATYTIGPGNFTYLSGEITGEDYIDGNYTILNPVGTQLDFTVYNASSFLEFYSGEPAVSQWNQTGSDVGTLVFSAPYTDTYYFVFTNVVPADSGIVVSVYVSTEYESNVGDDGMA